MLDLFGEETTPPIKLRDKFIEPPFSILDSKPQYWRKNVNKWKSLGVGKAETREGTVVQNGGLQKLLANSKGGHSSVRNHNISIFDPYLSEVIYRWFCPPDGAILDPFAGGDVRGVVANYLGLNYTGIDIRQEQVEKNKERAAIILQKWNQPTWITGDSNKILDRLDKSFDFIFSCPPYSNMEIYSKINGDISNMSYSDFLNSYKSIIKKSCNLLKYGGFAAFIVGEIRDNNGNYRGFVPDTINAFRECGMNYYNECIYLQGMAGACLTAGRIMGISKKIKKIHQNILIFKKPNK